MASIRFTTLGKSKFVHVARTKAQDLKSKGGSECQQVRKFQVANTVPKKGLSPEAAAALEPCQSCNATTHIITALKASQSPEDRKAAAADRTALVRERASGKKPRKAAKVKAVKAEKAEKPKKTSMTKSGPRSVVSGAEDGAKAKAELLAAFGDEHGWKSKLLKDADTGHWVLVQSKGDAVINTYFIDGKYDVGRHAEIIVGEWNGKLRGAHAVRRQMSLEGRDRPYPSPGKGRSVPHTSAKADEDSVPDDESPQDATRRVPFLIDDDASTIIEAVKGKVVRWRNGVSNGVEEARLSAEVKGKKRDRITITEHPQTGKRMINFMTVVSMSDGAENYGPERSVYLDKIVRVKS